MRKTVITLLTALLALPCKTVADTYTQLWKQVDEAARKDLPKTQIDILTRIAEKAEAEADYGQLLKAETRITQNMCAISADSLAPAVARTVAKAEAAKNKNIALAAVYYTVAASYYRDNGTLGEDRNDCFKELTAKALADPKALAGVKATDFEPFTVKGRDGSLFNNDLLSLIGYRLKQYRTLHDYYKTTSNRAAAVVTAVEALRDEAERNGDLRMHLLRKSKYAASLDSLIDVYSDVKACAEAVIARYEVMDLCSDVTPADKVNYINKALSRCGDWASIGQLRNHLQGLTSPYFRLNMNNRVVYPNDVIRMPLQLRNVKKITISLTRTTLNGGANDIPLSSDWEKEQRKRMIAGTTKTITKTYMGHPDYEAFSDTLTYKGLPTGVYIIDIIADNDKSSMQSSQLYVSSLYILAQAMPDDRTRFTVLDTKTGLPVSGATVVIKGNSLAKTSLKCDANGRVTADKRYRYWNSVRAYTATDAACPFREDGASFWFNDNDGESKHISLYTDRAIYRPGQTVHVSVVAYKKLKTETDALAGTNVKLELRDANYKVVTEKEVTTDSLGNAWAAFALPSGGLTGRFSLRVNGNLSGSTAFRVEEYKRPTFTVELPDVNSRYANGDTLVITGHAKTFAGVPVQGATVRYTVRRNSALWWRAYSGNMRNGDDRATLNECTTKTDTDGAFKMEVPMVLPEWSVADNGISKDDFKRIARFYNITADVSVTDLGGETRSASISLPLGSKPTSFIVEMPEKELRDSLKTVKFLYRNMAGKDIAARVRYTVDNSAVSFTTETNRDIELDPALIKALKSGRHTLTAVCGTDTATHAFTVFGLDDTAPCVESKDWFYISGNEFHNDNTPVYVQFGSSDSDVYVLYTVFSGNKVITDGTLRLTNSVKTWKFKYKEEYGNGIRINLIWLKNGQRYTHSENIVRPMPDKRLIMKWTTFRDRLTPGQKETWTLNITRPDGTPADASLAATLYDASLDLINKHSWYFEPGLYRPMPYYGISGNYQYGLYLNYSATGKHFSYTPLEFGKFDFNSYLSRMTRAYFTNGTVIGSTVETLSSIKVASPMVNKSFAMAEKKSVEDLSADAKENAESEGQSGEIQMRENLNETAFFAPALKTDGKGNVTFGFTLPESITTWRFMGFAHDRKMNYGNVTAETVAKKTVMIQPNMPRFVRSGDKATITAKVFNTSDKTVKGTARIILINSETETKIMEQTTPFNVIANGTDTVSFNWNPSDNHQLLICQVMATGSSFSDGEQHYLPVLPSREMTITTLPFIQTTAGTANIDLKGLFPKGATHKRLTIEYTNNPTWLTIQALPYMATTYDKNIISLSTALYANSLGSYIMELAPQVKSVFEQWRRETDGENGSLVSALEKNSELKNIVLGETPWVAEAKTEAEQKRSIANYFDENLMHTRNTAIMTSMKKLQNRDGSWSWWPEMPGSQSLTMQVVKQMARLDRMTGSQMATETMFANAISYIGKQAIKVYEDAKLNEKRHGFDGVSESFALDYLYINAMLNRKPKADEAKAAEYMLAKLKKSSLSVSLHAKALMAVVMAQQGETALAKQYLQSLDEYTVATESMGRYYDSPGAGYSWCDYRIPTQVAAIEAMRIIDAQKYKNTITEMQRWLLRQKQTQMWNTAVNSADAVFAFIDGNTFTPANRTNTVLKIDGKQIETSSATAGIGYVKATVSPERASSLTAEKQSEGTSWGAVYALSMQKTSDIKSAKSGFGIKRELLTADGKPAKSLKVGDLVKVKITIQADRNYDFVQIKDNRAACMEPVNQTSGYRSGCYCTPKDNATCFFFNRISKGTHMLETEYVIDRKGTYETGTCSVQCAYSPEYTARTVSQTIEIK